MIIIRSAVSFRDDMVDTGRLLHHTATEMFLTKPLITLQNAGANDLPLRAVAALVPGLPWFVLTPALTFVLLTVT